MKGLFRIMFILGCLGMVAKGGVPEKNQPCALLRSDASPKGDGSTGSPRAHQSDGDVDCKIAFVDDQSLDLDENNSKSDEATYNLYTQANYFHSSGNTQKTVQTYKKLFEKKPPIFVYDGYFRFLFDVGQILKIVEIYQKNEDKFKKNFEHNLDFNLLVAQALLMSNQDEKAEKIFVNLAKEFPDNEQHTILLYLL
jgi:tetratricopeptide (TPR) repeat protein